MPCKVTLFFSQVGSGWSETWYHNSDDPQSVMKFTLTPAMLKYAVNFRHELTYLVAARATRISGVKQSFTRSFGSDYHGLSAGTVDVGPDIVSSDAVVAVRSSPRGLKRMFVRGLNDNDIKRNAAGRDTPAGSLTAGLTNYLNSFSKGGFAIRVLKQPPEDGLTWTPVISVVTVAGVPTQVDVKTSIDVAAPIAVGETVRFARVPGDSLPGFPSQAIALDINPGGVSGVRISYTLRGGVSVFPPSMQLTAATYLYNVIDGVDTGFFSIVSNPLTIERFSEHKTGRPFGLLRGRARAKVRAH